MTKLELLRNVYHAPVVTVREIFGHEEEYYNHPIRVLQNGAGKYFEEIPLDTRVFWRNAGAGHESFYTLNGEKISLVCELAR